MTYRQATFLAVTAIGMATVTAVVVNHARDSGHRDPIGPETRHQTASLGTDGQTMRFAGLLPVQASREPAAGANPAPKARPNDARKQPPNASAPAPPRGVLIRGVPHVLQKPDFCGEACAAMMLQKLGRPVDQDYVFDCSGLDPVQGRGCYTRELVTALRNIGFDVGPVWYKIIVKDSQAGLEQQWRQLHADLADGVGTIICMRTGDGPEATEHFRLVLGYDAEKDEVIYHEPARQGGAYRRMARADLLRLWPLKYAPDAWTLIRIPLRPSRLAAGKASETFTAADYAQHIMRLKKKVPQGFTIVVQPPFVVIGDDSPQRVNQYAAGTVQWAVTLLKKSYFTKDPTEILDIWLFKDEPSYRKHTESIFHTRPDTPFGYYSHTDRALVMNIGSGGGTLVHEIVHPFVQSNFPECPAWLNEGLGSLYEQSAQRNGRIVGLTNWRLDGLQKAVREKRVPSFKTLCSTTPHQFYNEDPGTNYAQARYLCYYLQEKGLLEKFYHRFHQQHATDPTGYQTLQEVLGRTDMDTFKKQWEAYVLGLQFQR